MSGPPRGHRVGQKIAELIGETTVKARTVTARLESDERARFNHNFAETLERELAPSLAAIFGDVANDPNTPEEMREYFRTLTHPQHQANIWLQLAAVLGLGLSGPGAAAAGLIQRLTAESLKKWGDVKLTPDQAANAVVKGHLDRGLAGEQALLAGMHDENFQVLVDTTGNPPGPETLLTMLNRKIIDAGTFIRGIQQGLIRDEWIDAISALRYGPILSAEAIAAEVEGHLDSATVASLLEENGVNAKWHDVLYATAGEPPGTQSMLELLNRRVVAQPDVVQAIRESRVKDKYIPAILEMRRHLMPERTVVSAVSKGVLSPEDGLSHLLDVGYDAADAAALIAEAHSVKTAKHKEIAESQVVKGYEDRLFTTAQATELLSHLGYDSTEVPFLLSLADHAREDKFRTAGVARVHARYVGYHLEASDASRALDGLGVASSMRDDLLHLWNLERDANAPQLTVAEWGGLWKRGVIDDQTFIGAMRAKGYSDRDATYLLALESPIPKGGRPSTAPLA